MNESTVSAFVTLGTSQGTGRELQLFLSNFGPEKGASPTPWVPTARAVSVVMDASSLDGRASWPSSVLLRRLDDTSTAPYDAWIKQVHRTCDSHRQSSAWQGSIFPNMAGIHLS